MKNVFFILAVLVFCFVLQAENEAVASLTMESDLSEFGDLPDRPVFSIDTDIFLGQRSSVRIWSNLYCGTTTLQPKEGGEIQPDYLGIQLGLDLPKSGGLYSTFFFNAHKTEIDFQGSSSTVNNFLFGYGKYVYFSLCHFALTGSISYDRYEISSAGQTGNGSGMQSNFFGEFGLDFIFGKWGIKPFYALQYDFMYHGRIGEPNSPTSVSDWNGHGLQQLFGLRLNWKVWSVLEFQGRMAWVHEMLGNPPPFYRGRFSPVQGTNTPAMLFYSGNTGRDWAWLGIGAKFEGIYGIYFFGDYDVLFNARQTSHLGSLGLCLSW